jgi:hypothetical protein
MLGEPRTAYSAGRLRALAGYLGIDWPWLRGRCWQLAHAGTAALLLPRSRHISTVGMDAACDCIGRTAGDHISGQPERNHLWQILVSRASPCSPSAAPLP